MDRACKRLGIAAAFFALCAAVLWFSSDPRRNEAETEMTGSTAESLFVDDIHLGSVAGVVLKNENGTVPLMLYDSEIQFIDAPADTPMDPSALKSFVYRMAHIPAEKKLEPGERLSDFGLEEPAASVSVICTDGETVRLFLGDEAPFESGWYIMSDQDSSVYLTDEVTARMMRYSADDFRKLDVLPELSAELTLKDLTGFGLIQGDEIIEISGTSGSEGISYMLRQPFEAVLDWEIVADSIFAPLTGLEKCRFVSADGDFIKYGFGGDNVIHVVAVISGKAYTLHFSDAGDGSFFVCRDGSSQIVKVDAGLLPFLKLRLSDLVSETLFSADAASLAAVHVESADLDRTVRITGTGEELMARSGEKTLTAQETVSFVKTVTMLPQAGVLTEEADVSGKMILRLTFSLRNGEEHILELIPVSEWYCAVVSDGSIGAVTYSSTVREIISEAGAILGG